jgi:tRNA-Thr(GGU) m(6)t(6)A37 methyltransferase TsaA
VAAAARYSVAPIGVVRSSRAEPTDDGWDAVESRIELAPEMKAECLDGIEGFSHAEVLYLFHLVDEGTVERGARHPRGNAAWPRVGILAQRGKDRPNRIGSTVVRILGREGRVLRVAGLDAVDGSPVLDIKPVFREFLPRGELRQPSWVRELTRDYWRHEGGS